MLSSEMLSSEISWYSLKLTAFTNHLNHLNYSIIQFLTLDLENKFHFDAKIGYMSKSLKSKSPRLKSPKLKPPRPKSPRSKSPKIRIKETHRKTTRQLNLSGKLFA